jgi:filamentous hemagglutinin family protein
LTIQAEATFSGSGTTLSGNMTIPGDAGQQAGSNLFHSFSVFNVLPGESATFTPPTTGPAIDNVINRVTGGTSAITGSQATLLDGPLNSTISGANFYLINPNGIIFGNNASIQVDGAFYASTGDFVRLADGGIYYADTAQTSVLTSAPPSAFGFLNANPASIDVGTDAFNVIQSEPGESLSLVGGTLNMGRDTGAGVAPAFLLAPGGGTVNLASVASPGEAGLTGGAVDVSSFSQLGEVNIRGGSVVDGKDVYIRAGQLVFDDGAVIPGFFSLSGLDALPNGGVVDIAVSKDITVTGTTDIFGFAPGVYTFAGTSAAIGPRSDVPNVRIQAGSLSLSGKTAIQSERFGPGQAATVDIDVDTLQINHGANISLNNFFAGPGGNLTISAQQIKLSGEGNPGFTGIASQSNFNPGLAGESHPDPFNPALSQADGGSINITATGAGNLIVREGAEISADSFALGRGGDISITAGDIALSRDGADTGVIAAQSILAGDAGAINIDATGEISISSGFQLSATTGGAGDGGAVRVTAPSISISGTNSGIFSATAPPPDERLEAFAALFGVDYATLLESTGLPDPDIFDVLATLDDDFGLIEVTDRVPGDAGEISATASQVAMSGESRIDSSTFWDGQGGHVAMNSGSLNLNGGAQIRSRSGGVSRDTGQVVVGTGRGGTVDLTVDGTTNISGQSTAGPSGISTSTLGDGNGGSISLTSGAVNLNDAGTISASSSGTGLAGNIVIDAGENFDSSGGRVTTQAKASDGGNIHVTAMEQVYLDAAEITTSVESGFGGGGNIDIDPKFVILNQSTILANAFGGPGGNINIVAGNFIISAQSRVDASSALGLDGTVNINSPDEEVAENLAVLPENYLDVTSLMSDRCGATAGASSLVDAGPGGVAVNPDGYLPSFATGTDEEYEARGGNQAARSDKRWWALAETHQPPLRLAQATCTR